MTESQRIRAIMRTLADADCSDAEEVGAAIDMALLDLERVATRLEAAEAAEREQAVAR